MVTLFKRKVAGKSTPISQNGAVYKALMNGLEGMSSQEVDRVVLTLNESTPSQNATGRWLTTKDTNYYPFEMLEEVEQDMIRAGKTYTIVALVRADVGNVLTYEDDGVEEFHRTHIVPWLPRMKSESQLNYITEGGIYMGDNLRQFAESAASDGWTSEAIEQAIRRGIHEYHVVTRRLIGQAGVYNSLERMEKRNFTPLEQIMDDLRKNIVSAKSK